jgi:hypothetical protein
MDYKNKYLKYHANDTRNIYKNKYLKYHANDTRNIYKNKYLKYKKKYMELKNQIGGATRTFETSINQKQKQILQNIKRYAENITMEDILQYWDEIDSSKDTNTIQTELEMKLVEKTLIWNNLENKEQKKINISGCNKQNTSTSLEGNYTIYRANLIGDRAELTHKMEDNNRLIHINSVIKDIYVCNEKPEEEEEEENVFTVVVTAPIDLHREGNAKEVLPLIHKQLLSHLPQDFKINYIFSDVNIKEKDKLWFDEYEGDLTLKEIFENLMNLKRVNKCSFIEASTVESLNKTKSPYIVLNFAGSEIDSDRFFDIKNQIYFEYNLVFSNTTKFITFLEKVQLFSYRDFLGTKFDMANNLETIYDRLILFLKQFKKSLMEPGNESISFHRIKDVIKENIPKYKIDSPEDKLQERIFKEYYDDIGYNELFDYNLLWKSPEEALKKYIEKYTELENKQKVVEKIKGYLTDYSLHGEINPENITIDIINKAFKQILVIDYLNNVKVQAVKEKAEKENKKPLEVMWEVAKETNEHDWPIMWNDDGKDLLYAIQIRDKQTLFKTDPRGSPGELVEEN